MVTKWARVKKSARKRSRQSLRDTDVDGGRYRLIRTIASGGMAQIYEAVLVGARGFERQVAIKRILPQHAHDPAMRRMFFDEARVASRLHHGNIVQILDFGVVDGSEFIVMEFVDGVDAARALKRCERFPEGVAFHVVAEIAHALHYAHTLRDTAGEPLGIVHRDVSPHNILLSWEGDVKLSDFGIALAMEREERTRTGLVKGKLQYMAPEQATGSVVTSAADIYSLGMTLQELLGDDHGESDDPVGRCTEDAPDARPSASEVAEMAGRLAAARLQRDARGALREWLAPLQEAISRRSALDDVVGLSLVAIGGRRFTVSRQGRDTVPVAVEVDAGGAEDEVDGEATTTPAVPGKGPRKRTRTRLALAAGVLVPASLIAGFALLDVFQPGQRARPSGDAMSMASVAREDAGPIAALTAVDTGEPPLPVDAEAPARVGHADSQPARSTASRRARGRGRPAGRISRPRPRPRPRPEPASETTASRRQGWLRIGGAGLAGARVEIDGSGAGYAPLERQLVVGEHVVVVKAVNTGKLLLRERVAIGDHHTRANAKRIIH
jgi:hypothetical protein